ncbi:hypothetical protein MKW94_012244 [Papaver nudicaule]|uniref:Tudor domain-containing protein n=1 Tax=Papaver nudicaule TaxID=74823 RepID=A0AA41RYF0_PAPNU|nr:hypothetical protein [Papaver nudicaule]
MASSPKEKQLEDHLKEAGKQLLKPPSSVDELLSLIYEVEASLLKVNQSPSKSMQKAISPLVKALSADDLLRHLDTDVKVAVASCITEITRITAPEAPYSDDQMKEIFELIVATFEKLFDTSDRSYSKRVSILHTVAKVQSCVVMLDLECDSLILEMFKHFLNTIRDFHPQSVFFSMNKIMSLVLEESEDISHEILSLLLSSLKKDNQDVLPTTRKLVEKVLVNCRTKLKPYLKQRVEDTGLSLNDYSDVVSCICQEMSDAIKHSDDVSEEHSENEGKPSEKMTSDEPQVTKEMGTEEVVLHHLVKESKKFVTSNGISNTENGNSLVTPTSPVKNPDLSINNSPSKRQNDLDENRFTRILESKKKNKKNLLGSPLEPQDDQGYSDIEAQPSERQGKKKVSAVVNEDKLVPEKDGDPTNDSEEGSLKKSVKKLDTRDSGGKPSLKKLGGEAKKAKGKTISRKGVLGDMSSKSNQNSANKRSLSEETLKTTSKRKQTVGKEEASKKLSSVEEHDENLVGSRIKVWWPDDKRFYEGVVDSFDPVEKTHKVLYVDGDVEVLTLSKERWEHVKEKLERKKMKTYSDSSTQHAKTDTEKNKTNMETTDSEDKLKDDDKLISRTKNIPNVSRKSKDGSGRSKESTAKTGSKLKEGTLKLGSKSKDDAPKTSGKSKVDSGGKSEKLIAKTDNKLQMGTPKINTNDPSASTHTENSSRTTSVSKPKDDILKIGSKSEDVCAGETEDCIPESNIGSESKDGSLKFGKFGSKFEDGCPAEIEQKQESPKLGKKSKEQRAGETEENITESEPDSKNKGGALKLVIKSKDVSTSDLEENTTKSDTCSKPKGGKKFVIMSKNESDVKENNTKSETGGKPKGGNNKFVIVSKNESDADSEKNTTKSELGSKLKGVATKFAIKAKEVDAKKLKESATKPGCKSKDDAPTHSKKAMDDNTKSKTDTPHTDKQSESTNFKRKDSSSNVQEDMERGVKDSAKASKKESETKSGKKQRTM